MHLPDDHRLERPTLADVPGILALVHASEIAAVGFADLSESEVVEALTAPGFDPARDAWLVRDAHDQLVGWGYLDEPTAEPFCEAYAHPAAPATIQATLISLLCDRIAQRAADSDQSEVVARAGAIPAETGYIQVLADAGFEFERQHARMSRPLTGSEQRPAPVPGYDLRPLRPNESHACHEVMRAAFAGSTSSSPPVDFGEFVAMPGIYWPDSLVVAEDGELVGAALLSSQAEDKNEGWVKWLGVRPEHRRRGLAEALLRTAFAYCAEQGRTAIGLGVDTTNPTGAYHLYESLGMTPSYRANIYQRIVRSAS